MLVADFSLSLEPALPTLGLPMLLGAASLLTVLTVWTYLGVRKVNWRRVAIVLFLRLSALVIAFSMMMRPSFAITQLDGVEATKLLVVLDASESMNVVEVEGKPSRWAQVTKLWASRDVQQRLQHLQTEQKIEVVKYLGAEDLRTDEPSETANGKRTDIGAWLRQLAQKHGHEKHLRGIVLFSDGADNGTRFSAQEEARKWRGIAPIHAFGVGDPANPKFLKDIAVTSLKAKPEPPELIFVRSPMTVAAIAQAPGFKDAEVDVTVTFEGVEDKKPLKPETRKLKIVQEKDQPVEIKCNAPEEAGEYKVTLKITPQPGEANVENNEISTFVQVSKEKINVLWVDRPRVYEAKLAISLALAPEKRFEVYYVEPTNGAKGDLYEFDKRHYDVIVIGDISAQQFSLGKPGVFEKIKEMVTKKKTGLLMLGGSETFVKGGWDKQPAILSMLPVKLDVAPEKAEFSEAEVRAMPTKEGLQHPFLKLDPDPKKNDELWSKLFDPLPGLSPLGSPVEENAVLLKGRKGELVMAARRVEAGHVVVFAGDSTEKSWLTPDSAVGYKRFWKQLVFWLAQQEDLTNQLWVKLDRRRLNANAAEVLNFTFGLRDKAGMEIGDATFTAKVKKGEQEFPVNHRREDSHQQGTFQGAKEAGEYELVITVKAKDIEVKPISARFLVALDDIEMLRPVAEHETLSKIAASAEGRFQVLDEQTLLQYLDELKSQVSRESRHKTTHWPDWKRVPASEQTRDQLAGLWHSFTLVSFLLFVTLLGGEWLLRRLWGLA